MKIKNKTKSPYHLYNNVSIRRCVGKLQSFPAVTSCDPVKEQAQIRISKKLFGPYQKGWEYEEKDIIQHNKKPVIEKEVNALNINNASILEELGYIPLGLRDERWEILLKKVIPIIGIERTKSYIHYYIRKFEKYIKNRNDLIELKFDMNKLNNSNFK